jgi:cobalamin biosynthesis Mg chelatase CobN
MSSDISNNPNRFWPDESEQEKEDVSDGDVVGAREARAVPGTPKTPSTTYRAPGMPAGAPEHLPSDVKIGAEIMSTDKEVPEKREWPKDEEDDEGVVRTGAKGASQTSSGVWLGLFFAVIIVVILSVFLYRYIVDALGL